MMTACCHGRSRLAFAVRRTQLFRCAHRRICCRPSRTRSCHSTSALSSLTVCWPSLALIAAPTLARSGSRLEFYCYYFSSSQYCYDNSWQLFVDVLKCICAYVQPDFFAVEIINSNVVFKFDLGGGPAEIVVNRNVSDGEWHEVIAER